MSDYSEIVSDLLHLLGSWRAVGRSLGVRSQTIKRRIEQPRTLKREQYLAALYLQQRIRRTNDNEQTRNAAHSSNAHAINRKATR